MSQIYLVFIIESLPKPVNRDVAKSGRVSRITNHALFTIINPTLKLTPTLTLTHKPQSAATFTVVHFFILFEVACNSYTADSFLYLLFTDTNFVYTKEGPFTKYVTLLGVGECLTRSHILSHRGGGVSQALSRDGTTS